MVPRAGFIGSETNLIMIASTGLCLAAGRFGLAPSTRNQVLEPGAWREREKENNMSRARENGGKKILERKNTSSHASTGVSSGGD